MALLLGNGHSTPAETATTGAALAMFALGLPGFCGYLYFVARPAVDAADQGPVYLYLVENGLNIVLAFALVRPLGVRGLALSLSIVYSVAVCLASRPSAGGSGACRTAHLGTPAACADRLGAHGPGRARGVQPLGLDQPSRARRPASSGPSPPAGWSSARA